MISWSYYGSKSWTYLFGENRTSDLLFKLIFCIFVVIGASMNLGPVVDFSDSAIFAMAIANIIGLYIMFPVVKRELDSYWSRLKSGQITKYRADGTGGT
jgi:AGCS family alanine or glycine:cation symporter